MNWIKRFLSWLAHRRFQKSFLYVDLKEVNRKFIHHSSEDL